MLGPGEPSSLPLGQPAGMSPGRFATQLRAGGIFTPGGRFGSWRGSSSRRSGTKGSVGTGRWLAAQLGPQEAVHEGVLERPPRRLDDVLAHADGGPVVLAVRAVDEHARDSAGALGGVEDPHLVVGQVDGREARAAPVERLAKR